MKLYKVHLRGLGNSTGVNLQTSYVLAEDSNMAYLKVRKWLDKNNYGFHDYRSLDYVTLLAEDYEYTETRTMLFL